MDSVLATPYAIASASCCVSGLLTIRAVSTWVPITERAIRDLGKPNKGPSMGTGLGSCERSTSEGEYESKGREGLTEEIWLSYGSSSLEGKLSSLPGELVASSRTIVISYNLLC